MQNKNPSLEDIAAKLRIGNYHRHVFICVGGACCPPEVGEAAWEALKEELKRRNLTPGDDEKACYRTKVGCLRVCKDGPIALVYPEGTYYSQLTADRIPVFVEQHLIQGQPLQELVFAQNPLPSTTTSPPSTASA